MFSRHLIFVPIHFLVIGIGVFGFVNTTHACQQINNNGQTPAGFASPVSLFTNDQMIKGECEGETVSVEIGNNSPLTYVYNMSHQWTGEEWIEVPLEGENPQGSWYPEQATGEYTTTNDPSWYVAYTCEWVNNSWRCGCTSSACSSNNWQIQAFVPPQSTTNEQNTEINDEQSSYVPSGYELKWNDEFDNEHFDTNYDGSDNWISGWKAWNVRALDGNSDKSFKMFDEESWNNMTKSMGEYLSDTGQWDNRKRYLHEVSDGTVKLRAYPTPPGITDEIWGYDWVAGMLSTELSYSQTYGYWETRVKINDLGDGQHIAIWLLPTTNEWPPEIDMLEVVGLNPSEFTANSHGVPGGAPMTFYDAPNGAKGWHTFGFEWTPEKMTWTVDGEVVREHSNYINNPLYWLVAWEIASNWPGQPTSESPWPAEIEFDYVRVYQK